MHINGGIFAAMLTPFANNGQVSPSGIAPLVDYILANDVDGLYVGGSSGESILQNIDERKIVLRETSKVAKGRCKLIAHVGAASTDDAVALAKVASDSRYDSLSAIPPYYYPHSFDAINDYYKAILDASDLPLIIYNIPALTGVDLGTSGLLSLMEDERISGVKFTSTDLFQFWQLRRGAPNKALFFGTDEMFLGAAASGADGGIGSTYNLIGDVYVGIGKALKQGNVELAQQLQEKSCELVSVLLKTGVLPGLKHALNRLGVPVGGCRLPFQKPSSDSLTELDSWMDHNFTTAQFNFVSK